MSDSVSRIVEKGTKSIWTYTKYADGTAECYGTTQHSITKTGTYWLPEITLPFTLVKPVNSCKNLIVMISGGAYFAPSLYPYYPTDKASVNTVGCAVVGATAKGDITASYFVRGRWK